MATKKEATEKKDEKKRERKDGSSFLAVDNTTKGHVLAFVLGNGLVACVPVTVRDAATVETSFTEVTE